MLNEIIKKITEQQKAHKPYSPVFCVGEQLKDICSSIPEARELVNRDLDIPELSIAKCEEKIKEFAKSHGGCTPPTEAHRIICEFYGIPKGEKQINIEEPTAPSAPVKKIDLLSFL